MASDTRDVADPRHHGLHGAPTRHGSRPGHETTAPGERGSLPHHEHVAQEQHVSAGVVLGQTAQHQMGSEEEAHHHGRQRDHRRSLQSLLRSVRTFGRRHLGGPHSGHGHSSTGPNNADSNAGSSSGGGNRRHGARRTPDRSSSAPADITSGAAAPLTPYSEAYGYDPASGGGCRPTLATQTAPQGMMSTTSSSHPGPPRPCPCLDSLVHHITGHGSGGGGGGGGAGVVGAVTGATQHSPTCPVVTSSPSSFSQGMEMGAAPAHSYMPHTTATEV